MRRGEGGANCHVRCSLFAVLRAEYAFVGLGICWLLACSREGNNLSSQSSFLPSIS